MIQGSFSPLCTSSDVKVQKYQSQAKEVTQEYPPTTGHVSLSDLSHISTTRVGNTSAAPVQNYHQHYQNNVADSSSYQDYSKFQEEIGETFKKGKQSLDSMAMVYM
jgi:hypothetical protein